MHSSSSPRVRKAAGRLAALCAASLVCAAGAAGAYDTCTSCPQASAPAPVYRPAPLPAPAVTYAAPAVRAAPLPAVPAPGNLYYPLIGGLCGSSSGMSAEAAGSNLYPAVTGTRMYPSE